MENYIVSARKYRPDTFSSVVGQKALTSTLRNAIATNKLAHAYLFCGSRGVGKTSCARIFAKAINCQHPTPDGDPCNECESCREFNQGTSLNIVELDAASNNGVDAMRELTDQVRIPPTSGRYRVFIIDEVHMLTTQAFNAFLKTLEEPPSYVIFILATTEKHKIIPTILSRCQIFDFNRITINDMIDHLEYVASQEGITAERKALGVIASKADGAMRDALSIFDQVAASSRGNITYRSTIDNLNVLDSAYYLRLVDAFLAGDVAQSLLIYQEVREHGHDSHAFINGLAAHLRNLMVAVTPATMPLLDTDPDTAQTITAQAAKCTPEFLYKAMSLCNDADLNYRLATSKSFLVELLLIKLCQLLSPSPIFSGDGEGQLKELHTAGQQAPAATATPRPQSTAASQPQHAAAQAPHPAQAPQVPHRTPVTPPPHIPAASPRSARAIRTIRINNIPEPQQDTPVAGRLDLKRDNEYTRKALLSAWSTYSLEHPSEHILANTMRAAAPQETSTPHLYTVTVENPAQQYIMNERMPHLLEYLRDHLNNDAVSLQIELNQKEPGPETWTERELFNHMIDAHPAFKHFATEFKLSLT